MCITAGKTVQLQQQQCFPQRAHRSPLPKRSPLNKKIACQRVPGQRRIGKKSTT
jgi:hypothetical protein